MKPDINKKLKILSMVYASLFLFICAYLLYFSFFESRTVAANSYNRRLRAAETNVLRGKFLDRKDEVLAKSVKNHGEISRRYLYASDFAHVIGYSSASYGSSALEAYYNKELMHANNNIETIKDKVEGNMVKGNNIKLTLDRRLQSYVSDLMAGKRGAVVVIKPETGEILSMVSKPDFNPSRINTEWSDLREDEDSPLLNRATEGLYPPGSIFKVVTAAAALEKNKDNQTFNCEGKVNIDGYEIKDSGDEKHGEIDINDAFKLSCNSYFIQLGNMLGIDVLLDEANKFRFNKEINSDFKVSTSVFPKKNDPKAIAQQSIGQGEVLITPYHAALIASTVANDGILMQPYMVSEISDASGRIIKTYKPKSLGQIIDKKTADSLKDMMIQVVKSGTGTRARSSQYKIAGKTGTAENGKGRDHAWFIGFAPADNPQVAVAVLVENGGSGGSAAAPIAGRVLRKALTLLK